LTRHKLFLWRCDNSPFPRNKTLDFHAELMQSPGTMPVIEFVIPLFNESEGLLRFHSQLLEIPLSREYTRRFIYVNDGSTDGTQQILQQLAASQNSVQVIELSRNFGHQAALSAGLDAATGDIVISLDGDGQHPPSLIPDMLKLHVSGCDVVQARRMDEKTSAGFLKRTSSRAFYRLLSFVGEVEIAEGSSDFRLLSRRALEALRLMPEYHRFFRGMTVWIGFPSAVIPYEPALRIEGESKYTFRKMLHLAADGLFSFSLVPLRIGLLLGLGFILVAAFEVMYVAYFFLSGYRERLVPGWSSLVLILTVSSAINMILIGILGIYVGMIFREVKHRPVYIVRSKTP
jgi:polyisoprenyl-phosphate glycosyltransferase